MTDIGTQASTTQNKEQAVISLPSDNEILLVRKFRAPSALVFDLWTKVEHVGKWYACETLTLTACDLDLRIGGKWRWGLRDERGMDHTMSGEYREITRPERLGFTEVYEQYPSSLHDVLITFEERGGVTTMKQLITHTSRANRDGHLQAMKAGVQEMYDRIASLAEAAHSPSSRASAS